MWGSYGSYSSLSSGSAPISIQPSSSRCFVDTVESHYANRTSSFSSASDDERPTSFLSDDDLFPCDVALDEDHHTITSASSTSALQFWSPAAPAAGSGSSPIHHDSTHTDFYRALELEAEAKRQRELSDLMFRKQHADEKRRRVQALLRQRAMRKRTPSSKKSSRLNDISE